MRAVLHRPLRHISPWIFCDMMNVDSLAAEGFEVPDGKNCVVHQLEILVSRNGNLTWTRESVESWLDEQQEALYSDFEDDNPYWDVETQQMMPWRALGVTATMVLELCKQRGVPVNILWRNNVVESFAPERFSYHVSTQALQCKSEATTLTF